MEIGILSNKYIENIQTSYDVNFNYLQVVMITEPKMLLLHLAGKQTVHVNFTYHALQSDINVSIVVSGSISGH